MDQAHTEAPALGEEYFFGDLWAGIIDPKMVGRVTKRSPTRVLDIGSGDGMSLVYFHYATGIPHMEGIEEMTEADVLEIKKRERTRRKFSVLPDLEAYWDEPEVLETDIVPKIPRSQLKSVFQITYNKDFRQYQPQLHEYDVVVLSQVLHFMHKEKAQQVIDRALSFLAPNGILYISIKDDFRRSLSIFDLAQYRGVKEYPMKKEEILTFCARTAKQQSLREYLNPQVTRQGQIRIYTNL